MPRTVIFGLVLIGFASWSVMAGAASMPPSECTADASTFCSDIPTGGTGLGKCLREHESELSSACQTALETLRTEQKQRSENIRTACSADVSKLCSNMQRTQVRSCLRQHKSELSDACRTAMTANKTPQQLDPNAGQPPSPQ